MPERTIGIMHAGKRHELRYVLSDGLSDELERQFGFGVDTMVLREYEMVAEECRQQFGAGSLSIKDGVYEWVSDATQSATLPGA